MFVGGSFLLYCKVYFSSKSKFDKFIKCRKLDVAVSVFNSRNKTLFRSNFFSKLFLCHLSQFSFFFNQLSNRKWFGFNFKVGSCFCANSPLSFVKMLGKSFDISLFCFHYYFLFRSIKYSSIILSAFFSSFVGVFWVFFWNPLKRTTKFPLSKQQNIL